MDWSWKQSVPESDDKVIDPGTGQTADNLTLPITDPGRGPGVDTGNAAKHQPLFTH